MKKKVSCIINKFLMSKFYQKWLFPLILYLENPFVQCFDALDARRVDQFRKHNAVMYFGYKKGSLMGKLCPGEFSHVGIYDKATGLIYEMVYSGWQATTVESFMTRYTRVVLATCKQFTPIYCSKLVTNCKAFRGTPYDNTFNFSIKSLYCSEMIYMADTEGLIKCSTKDILGIGGEYISPDGLYNADNIKILLDMTKH